MRLSKIQLRNFRCFEDTTVDLHPNCTVIAGVNGSGKSSVLEGLALCLGQWLSLYGLRSPVIRPEHVRLEQREINRQVFLDKSFPVEVDASWEHEGGYSITNVRLEREGLLTEFPDRRILEPTLHILLGNSPQGEQVNPLFRYFSGDRANNENGYDPWKFLLDEENRAGQAVPALNGSSRTPSAQDKSRLEGYYDCLSSRGIHRLCHRLRSLALAEQQNRNNGNQEPDTYPLLAAIANAARLALGHGKPEVKELYYDLPAKCLRCSFVDGTEQQFANLSEGERSLIALFADIAWRSAVLNPQFGAEAPQKTPGVVLIEEIALRIHPSWQRTVLPNLQRAFPQIQFIVTTHSPVVLSSVPAEQIRFMKANGEVEKANLAKGMTVDEILELLMDVGRRDPAINVEIQSISDNIESDKLDEARKLLEELKDKIGHNNPAIVNLEWELHEAEVDSALGAVE